LPGGDDAAAEVRQSRDDLAERSGRDACHSIRPVTPQRLSRKRRNQLLDWMVAEQGMAELTAEERRVILGYLAARYGQDGPRS
jgi:hypothetical protein